MGTFASGLVLREPSVGCEQTFSSGTRGIVAGGFVGTVTRKELPAGRSWEGDRAVLGNMASHGIVGLTWEAQLSWSSPDTPGTFARTFRNVPRNR